MCVAGILWALPATAQQRGIDVPQLPQIRGQDMGVIMDGSMFSSGSRISVRMSVENGVRKIHAEEDGVRTVIDEDPSGHIVVRITRQYGPGELDQLMEDHPALYMSVKDFPTTTEDAEAVEVSVGVTRKFEAESVEALQEKHPQAHAAWEKYTSGGNGLQIFRGRFGDELLLPEIRIQPDLLRLDRDDPQNRKQDEQPQPATPDGERNKDKDT
jgi:hypothetical protein